MSHDDFASNDEIKEFKEEGEELASEDLVFQLKSSLIDQIRCLPEPNKVPMVRGGPSPQFFSMLESLRPPPPAHMGGCYPMSLDPKTGISRGIPPWHPSQYSPSVYNEFAQFQWHSAAAAAGMYQMNVNAFRNPYPTGLSNGSFTNFPASFVPSHPGLPGHPHHHHHHHHHHPLSHPFLHSSSNPSKHVSELAAAVTAMSPLSQSHSDSLTRRPGSSSSTSGSISSASSSVATHLSFPHHSSPGSPIEMKYNSLHSPNSDTLSSLGLDANHQGNHDPSFFKNHVKKPLNAFMLFMKENRAEVVAEVTLKESAAINQILGKKWHSLSREEQAKYYEKAKSERQAHMQRYPGWTAKDNYAVNQKKKKKKRDKSSDGEGGSLKKCRARFGLERQSSWCKPCRRKKKCTRFTDNNETNIESDCDNMNSIDSSNAPTLNSSHNVQFQPSPSPSPSLSSSNSVSLSCPPRASPLGPNPFSIEHLTRPHCPPSLQSSHMLKVS